MQAGTLWPRQAFPKLNLVSTPFAINACSNKRLTYPQTERRRRRRKSSTQQTPYCLNMEEKCDCQILGSANEKEIGNFILWKFLIFCYGKSQ